MPTHARVAGVVPASGLSTRIGTAKALLDAGGRTFLDRITTALLEGGCDPVLAVVRDPGGPIAAAAKASGATVVPNPDPEEGPISSIRCAIEVLAPDVAGIAVCPVDHPLVRPDAVTSVIEAFVSSRPPILIPTFRGRRGHPTVFDRSVFSELQEPELREGARTVIRRHVDEVLELALEHDGILVDIDTLPDYRRRFPDAYRRRFQSR